MVNKRGWGNKKAQGSVFGMSFGVIFSIIIIVFILVVAGIAINHFLKLRKCAQVGMFIDDLQKDIDKAWNSQKSNFPFPNNPNLVVLPSNLEYVCFANFSNSVKGGSLEREIYDDISIYKYTNANLFFYPREKACNMPYIHIKHIDIEKITELRNPYCVKVKKGKIVIKIEKGFNEALVSLG